MNSVHKQEALEIIEKINNSEADIDYNLVEICGSKSMSILFENYKALVQQLKEIVIERLN